MKDKKTKIWVVWLCFVSFLVFLSGSFLLSLGISRLFFEKGTFFSIIINAIPVSQANNTLWWFYSLFGLISIFTGLALIFISVGPFKKIAKWAWSAIFVIIMIWFSAGATMSVLYFIYYDLIIYSSILVLFLLPLLFTQKLFVIPENLL